MRIIKQEQLDQIAKKIHSMQFDAFPAEWLVNPPAQEADEPDYGGNGRDHEPEPQQPAIDLAAVQQQADQIVAQGQYQAEQMTARAQQEAQAVADQARQQAQAILDQARQQGEEAKKEAFASGFSSGEESGYKKGYEDGYGKGKALAMDEASQGISMLNRVIDELESYRTQILYESKQDIVKMALAVAEKVLHKEIMTDPNTVVSVVKNAISKVGFKRNFTVHVNPLDVEVLKAAGSSIAGAVDSMESLKFKPDPKVEPGGCVVHTESGTVDAQVDRQFQEIKENVLNAMQAEENEQIL
jgi:flagellar assembly protein FliH